MFPEQREAEARLGEIVTGPWAAESKIAWNYLQPQRNKPGKDELAEVLRPHWRKPITEAREIEIRDSLDQALLELQILELAASTGYLPLKHMERTVRERFDALLWSEAAQEFVRNYRYYGVIVLAHRFGLEFRMPRGLQVTPVDESQALRFASFLFVVRETYETQAIRQWQDRLDDYFYRNERSPDFGEYLKHGDARAPSDDTLKRIFQERAFGMAQFIERYGDFFKTVSPNEWPRYGLVPLYWLEKLFGYERSEEAFYYEEALDWSKDDVLFGQALVPRNLPIDVREEARGSLESKCRCLKEVLMSTHAALFALEH
jgi:hypothetical protein